MRSVWCKTKKTTFSTMWQVQLDLVTGVGISIIIIRDELLMLNVSYRCVSLVADDDDAKVVFQVLRTTPIANATARESFCNDPYCKTRTRLGNSKYISWARNEQENVRKSFQENVRNLIISQNYILWSFLSLLPQSFNNDFSQSFLYREENLAFWTWQNV